MFVQHTLDDWQAIFSTVVVSERHKRTDEDEDAIPVFENLLNSVDAIPSSLIASTEKIRASMPELFEETLALSVQAVKIGFVPTSATEFVETVNQVVKDEFLRRQPAR
jgi:hypothetical protein